MKGLGLYPRAEQARFQYLVAHPRDAFVDSEGMGGQGENTDPGTGARRDVRVQAGCLAWERRLKSLTTRQMRPTGSVSQGRATIFAVAFF
eukprot:CAMPEP_0169469380 /NCGR_PEP_ID=MMETSP1042-20121227/23447_1 /TAXON_ID=464988 /ORGANISM="Hemiselmis andersenii, Strain CCMP1180" /LENGTH=89 /DNA_ID=CAMNT_0009582849 /DNA_START=30 /DNA_END=297 /DNA_ORIENTATION=-